MSKRTRLDKVTIVDLELSCWEHEPPPGQYSDIISIGAVELLLDEEAPRMGRMLSILVKPERSEISQFCTSLTGITPGMAAKARPFSDASASLRKAMGGSSKAWGGWGDDRTALAEAAARHGELPPLEGPYIDFGALWGMFMGAPKAVGLTAALRSQGLEFEGKPHRALDDAINAARVIGGLASVLRNNFEVPYKFKGAEPAEKTDVANSPWSGTP